MPWSTLASNQTVTFNNLQDAVNTGVFTAKTSIPASNECITKTDANNYVNINTSNAGYASKASNQLVYKADLTAPSTGVVFTVSSGLYPVTTGNASAIGTLYNYNSYTVYVKLLFNSAGLNSGVVNNDTMYLGSQYIRISGAVITSYGQDIYSNVTGPVPSVPAGIFAIPNNSSNNITIDKIDGFGSGTTLKLAYSTSPTGTYTPI